MKETATKIPLTCTEIADRGLIERYVAGALSTADVEVLEAHLLDCPSCQTELRLAVAIRGALREPAAAASQRRVGIRFAGVGLALAAGIAAVIMIRASSSSKQWRDLGAVPVAPIYLGVEVRGTPARGDSVFALAMTAYDDRRYDAASAGLRMALTAGADSAPAEFFLAAALLMQDHASEADKAFGRVISRGDTPYLGEARLYRAKALLREGRAADALAELRTVASSANAVSAWALALADSVESRMRR